ncbi:MAG: GNAT family N-acetyltransferase [Chloroflexota bacterium]|jgi:ribosomal protein S18 acetylase RimI-like enzyme|nr:GNAT family N-acetyltransferase [Chloroflexota bacterium]
MRIFEMKDVTQEIFQTFQRLIPQLTRDIPPPTLELLEAIAASPDTFVYLVRYPEADSPIVASATLATFRTPTGRHGWIEDVVVDYKARRQGIGKALTEKCLDQARDLGLRSVNLTSRPSREAANRLYQDLNFTLRETNVYRYSLD